MINRESMSFVQAEKYECPSCGSKWSRRSIGQQVPDCPNFCGKLEKLPPAPELPLEEE